MPSSLFTNQPRKAKLEMTHDDGTVQVVEFYVQRIDMQHKVDVCDIGYGGYQGSWFRSSRIAEASARSCNVTLTGLLDASKSFVVVPTKKEKPAPKPKLPSVNASARALRKNVVKHAKLTAQIFKAERALIDAKNQKAALDTELQKSREQLLAAAGGVPTTR
jgi:hypothetical protein